MKHPNGQVIEKFYSDFTQGNFSGALSVCADAFTFQVSGKSKLAGKYTRSNFASDFGMKLNELSAGSFQFEVHDVLASDLHVTVLGTARLTRNGKPVEYRTVHVWRFDGGKPLAGYEYPRDLYAYDAIWS